MIINQVFALAILSAAMYLAYRRWVKPLGRLDLQEFGAMMLTLLALTGGFVGSIFWWIDEPRSFSWDLPPLASRMLASAGWSFFVLCIIALQRPTFHRVRLVMLNLFVYLVPLAAVIFLFHIDYFDPDLPITYTFFATAISMSVASTWYLIRPVRILDSSAVDQAPPSPAVRSWMIAVAVVTGLWGLALFITDRGPSDLVWAWPGDLLTSRLIGVMLLTICAGSLYSMRFADTTRQMLAMTITYSLGLAVASFWNTLSGKPIKPAYLLVFGVIFLVSVGLMIGQRRTRLAPVSSPTKVV